jgi:energy-coupling factor transport system ATP-binding protein
MKDIIRFEDLVFRYTQDGKEILKGVNIQVHKGEFLAVLGHNGSGKSTLAKHSNAILLPSGGSVRVYDMDTRQEENLYQIRQTVGMVFQNPDNQIVATVVEEDVAFAPENLGVPPREIRQRVDDALERVGMSEYKRHAPHMLSGGQKQRVAIAGCLAMKPECIVLDEPTAMLDPKGRREVIGTIKRLNEEEGTTVLLITHYMNEAAMADRIIVMDEGEVVLEGTPKEVFTHVEELKKRGLDVPQTTELMYQLRQHGCDVPLDTLSDEECVEALVELMQKQV